MIIGGLTSSLRGRFIDEKLVVPVSWLHEVESSLAAHLEDRIASYQHYLGQVRLYRPDEISNHQTMAAFDGFTGHVAADLLGPDMAFLDHPDQKVERFGIRVDGQLDGKGFREGRHRTARDLEGLRQRLLKKGMTYDAQLRIEQNTQREEFLRTYCRFAGGTSAARMRELTDLPRVASLRTFRF